MHPDGGGHAGGQRFIVSSRIHTDRVSRKIRMPAADSQTFHLGQFTTGMPPVEDRLLFHNKLRRMTTNVRSQTMKKLMLKAALQYHPLVLFVEVSFVEISRIEPVEFE